MSCLTFKEGVRGKAPVGGGGSIPPENQSLHFSRGPSDYASDDKQ